MLPTTTDQSEHACNSATTSESGKTLTAQQTAGTGVPRTVTGMQHREQPVVVIDDLRTLATADVHLRTSAEALVWLQHAHAHGQHLSEVWFDHDLGGDDTTMVIVDWLCERAVWDDYVNIGLVVVHSANPPAAETIVRTLRRWYDVVRVDANAAGMTA